MSAPPPSSLLPSWLPCFPSQILRSWWAELEGKPFLFLFFHFKPRMCAPVGLPGVCRTSAKTLPEFRSKTYNSVLVPLWTYCLWAKWQMRTTELRAKCPGQGRDYRAPDGWMYSWVSALWVLLRWVGWIWGLGKTGFPQGGSAPVGDECCPGKRVWVQTWRGPVGRWNKQFLLWIQ